MLADGLDVELAHRFVKWFSVHMSNFNFQWVWKEWYAFLTPGSLQYSLAAYRIPDLSLSPQHPKRVYMRRAVDNEIRLAYYDRILKTLPEPMQSPDALVLPSEAPGPDFEYDDPGELID